MSNPSNQGSNRRQFLGQSSGALAAGALLTTSARAAHYHAGGSDTLRVGLIGCGGRGRGASLDSMNSVGDDSVQLVAVADVFEDRVKEGLEYLQGEKPKQVRVDSDHKFVGFDAYQKLLESDIDLVILTTPPGFRPLHFEAAVKAGKNVFMEKPLATDSNGIRRILAANETAKKKNLLVQVGLQRRHEPKYQETIARLQDGAIGDINLMRAYWNGDTPWVHPRQDGQTELEYQLRNWYFFDWICGDHIVEQHIHNLDVINWLKKGYPVKAQGQGGRQVRVGKEFGQIYDHHMVEFTYADGSVLLSQCRHQTNTWQQVAEFAHGSKGTAHIADGAIFDTKGKEAFRSTGKGGGWALEHVDLVADLRKGNMVNEAEYGAYSTMTAIMGRIATYSGKVVPWDKLLNLDFSLADTDAMSTFDSAAPVEADENGFYPVAQPGKYFHNELRS